MVVAAIAVCFALLAVASPLGAYKGVTRVARPLRPRRGGRGHLGADDRPLSTCVFLPVGLVLRARGRLGITRGADRRPAAPTGSSTEERDGADPRVLPQAVLMKLLGISCYYHDSAACLVDDGRIVAAAQEERFTRKKHDEGFPTNAVRYCLAEGGRRAGASSTASSSTTSRCSSSTASWRPTSRSAPSGLRSAVHGAAGLAAREAVDPAAHPGRAGGAAASASRQQIFFTEHHESHAASAFYPSPFEEAAVLTLDGVGEWATTTIGVGEGNRLRLIREIDLPALARPALLGLHLLHRLQGELGRVQADGPRPLRRGEVHRPHQARAGRHPRTTAPSA